MVTRTAVIVSFSALVILMPTFGVAQDEDPPGADDSEARADTGPRADYLSGLVVEFEERLIESATVRPRRMILSPSSVTRLSGADIRRSGARFFTDALRGVAGVEVMRQSSVEANVNVRGFNETGSSAQGMLALVDGRPVYNDLFGNAFWDGLIVTMHEIDQVEIVRGPGSFLHGTNALHGLVSIKTRSPLEYERDTVSLSLAGGGYDSSVASAIAVRRTEHSGYKTVVAWDDVGDFDDETDDGSDKRKKSMKVHYEREFESDHRVGLSGGVASQRAEIFVPSLFGGFIPSAILENDAEEIFANIDYRCRSLQGRVSWTHYDIETVANLLYGTIDSDMDTVDADLRYSFRPFSSHETTVGIGYRVASIDTSNADLTDGRRTIKVFSAYFEDTIEILANLECILGLRFDRHSNSGEDYSPRAALVWEFMPQQALRCSYGVGIRTPSLRENYATFPVALGIPGVEVQANRDLDAEKLQSFELGYAGQPVGGLWARLTTFYNIVDDEIQALPSGGVKAQQTNTGQQEAYGAELELECPITHRVNGFTNYSYTIRKVKRTNERVSNGPRHKGNAGIDVSFLDSCSARVWAHFFDETEFEAGKVPEYWLLNLQVAYRFSFETSGSTERDPDLPPHRARGEAFLRVFNLLDNRHREHPETDVYGIIAMVGIQLDW